MDKLKILGIEYQIITGETDSPGATNAIGQHHSAACKIWIDVSKNNKSHQKSVLLHEIIEALNFRLEIELKHPQITQLEAGLFEVLTSNPGLLEYFTPSHPHSSKMGWSDYPERMCQMRARWQKDS